MNKETAIKYFGAIALGFSALWIFHANPYMVVVMLCCYFAYDVMQGEEQIKRRSLMETKSLKNEIKTTTKDAYLKHKQLITMVSNLPLPLILLDVRGNFVIYNNSFNELREGKEDRKLDYINNDCYKSVAEFIKDAFIFECNLGKTIEIGSKAYEAIAVPITTQGKFSGCVILFQDITIAKEKESMQKQFIADASHELKTPISVIKGMVEILSRDDFDDIDTQKEFLKQIEKETNRLEFIVKDLLQLSRLSVSTLIMNKEYLDFTNVIDHSIDSFVVLARQKGLVIEKEYHTRDKILVDRDLCTTLMNNLISNAIKYSDTGVITVSTQEENNEYIVRVKDEGVGMSKEDCEHIFERFYRVDKARSRKSGGSGLGLSIAKSIAEAHDAILEVESELQKGSTFIIHFKK